MEKIEFDHARRSRKAKKKKLDRLYDKKPLIELIVAFLSIPSLLLLVILNYNSVKNLNGTKPTPTPVSTIPSAQTNTTAPNFFTAPITKEPQTLQSDTTAQEPCTKSLGPVSIASPNEDDTVNSNPVEVDISYNTSTYCGAVWSYSVNGSNWSDYSNNSVALYNLPDGPVTFSLRVKSLTSSDSTTLTRHFTYTGQSSAIQPTTASSSAH